MESIESPLEVLSRAATMVQDSLPNHLHNDESSKPPSTKQLPTTKWKRDRRRLPEYSRKSDPKLTDNLANELRQSVAPSSPPTDATNRMYYGSEMSEETEAKPTDAPIDMSVRQRGLPPSYTQTINSPGYRAGYKSLVITQAPVVPASRQEDLPAGISMCDPIIDEHFRRSLGKDYITLFNNKSLDSGSFPPAIVRTHAPSDREILTDNCNGSDGASLVDDHFAKALGDTWLKLNSTTSKNEAKAVEKNTIVSL